MAIKIASEVVINDDRELVLAKLTDINETKNDTAVDVFIYDTSKDSDGGAWRHRTQHTSWYNEGASSTRGSRKEFPAVAVIVAEAGKVTIYDGDDPSLPMWRVFLAANTNYLLRNGGVVSISAKNGILCVLTQVVFSSIAYFEISFVSDGAVGRNIGGVYNYNGVIADSNDGTTTYGSAVLSGSIANNTVNDVAMTVLPDAPTDPATGLEIPTIAVATAGGVSVITDSGAVYDSQDTAPMFRCAFKGSDLVYARTSADHLTFIAFANDYSAADGFGDVFGSTSGSFGAVDMLVRPNDIAFDNSEWFFGSKGGATNLAKDGLMSLVLDETNNANSMSALTTSTYNTGWMPGDIKLAALADTTAETFGDAVSGATVSDPNGDGVYDGEHITNGTFDTDTSGWNAGNGATLSLVSNALRITSGASGYGRAVTPVSVVSGKTYDLRVEKVAGTNFNVGVSVNSDGSSSLGSSAVNTGRLTWVSDRTGTVYFSVSIQTGAASATLDIDNASVRLADPDRSVNGKGLAVHGSITKAPVATGADVVAYSGFSSSNYLEQPYNSDLDFGAYTGTAGTGDFCVMGWVNKTGTSYKGIIDRHNGSTYAFIVYTTSTNQIRVSMFGSTVLTTTDTLSTGVWQLFTMRRSSGTLFLGINGNEVSVANSIDVTLADAVTTLGVDYGGTVPFDGYLALFRISATAPTADQIAKIYNDEKVLFQDSAKATLTGSSDAVTALAHDPDTNLLHVGTSGGRSVFQGLRRVEEHTGTNSQSLAAISAVDGLVVEGK